MHLFFTQGEGLVLSDGHTVTRTEVVEAGFPDRMPFFVSDDGCWLDDINGFLRDLPRTGRTSPNTWAAYAHDIHTYLRWLDAKYNGRRRWWEATPQDLLSYKDLREDPRLGMAVSAKTWNRSVAALRALYEWALTRKLISVLPFKVVQVRTRTPNGTEIMVNTTDLVRAPDEADARPRFLTTEQFRWFRDHGLASKRERRGRHADRNYVAANLFATSGIREREAVILVWELPPESWLRQLRDQGESLVEHRVPHGLGKRSKTRITIVSRRTMESLWSYVRIGRAATISKHTDYRSGEYRSISRPIRVARVLDQAGRPTDEFREVGAPQTRAMSRVTEAERCRMVEMRNGRWEPVALFLNDLGAPMTGAAWWKVFRTASLYCAEMGRQDLASVHPHMMRHTFAVNLLEHLERKRLANAPAPGVIREIDMVSSMTVVQRFLGHSHPTTTAVYVHEVRNRLNGGEDAYREWLLDVDGEEA